MSTSLRIKTEDVKPGMVKGELVVKALTSERNPDGKRLFVFTCSCGKEVKRSWTGRHRSCGHLKNRVFDAQNLAHRRPLGEASFNCLYGSYKRNARIRDLSFELTREAFRAITSSNCYYCNEPPKRVHKQSIYHHGGYKYNGIDRLDNNVGYTNENSLPCCFDCNVAKSTHDVETFAVWIARVYATLKMKGLV